MELNDNLVSFRPATAPALQETSLSLPTIRVAFVSERPDLKRAMQRALGARGVIFTPIVSTKLVERAIDKKLIDVAIIDIERQDEWPDSVFSRFDELAAGFPIIVLCSKSEEILHYIRKARHLVFVFCHETIDDPRFIDAIRTAQLCADVAKKNHDQRDWTPRPAA